LTSTAPLQPCEEATEVSHEPVDGRSRQRGKRLVLDLQELFDELGHPPTARVRQHEHSSSKVVRVWPAPEPAFCFESVQPRRQCAGPDHRGGHIAILEAGRATLELVDDAHASYIDDVEVGHRSAGHVRVALGVSAMMEQSQHLVDAGLAALAPPTVTPFGSTNARFELPHGLQLTLFG
jgi:hypothetical protein